MGGQRLCSHPREEVEDGRGGQTGDCGGRGSRLGEHVCGDSAGGEGWIREMEDNLRAW